MKTHSRLFLIMAAALLIASSAPETLAASAPKADKAAPATAQPAGPASLAPKDVDSYMATLTDAQARRLLRDKLAAGSPVSEPAGEAQPGGALRSLLERWEKSVRGGLSRHETLLAAAGKELREGVILSKLSDGQGASGLVSTLMILAAICAGSLFVHSLVGRQGAALIPVAASGPFAPRLGRTGLILAQAGLRLLAVAAFFLTAFILFVALTPASGALRHMAVIMVTSLTYYLLIQAAARILLAPGMEAARLIPLGDEAAAVLYRWLMLLTLASLVVAVFSVILSRVGEAWALGDILYAQAGPVTGVLLAAMIYCNRRAVALAISGSSQGKDAPGGAPEPGATRMLAARYWHYPAMAYALAIGLYWSVQAISGGTTILSLVTSLFLIPCCIGVDLWVKRLLLAASGQDREIIHMDAGSEPHASLASGTAHGQEGSPAVRLYIPLIRRALRVALAAFAAFAMLKMWGVEIPVGWLFARNVLSVLLVGVGGLLLWEVVRIRIDRRLREESSLPGEEMEEGGGAGGSRSATLLLLLRKFVLCVIVVIGSLVALSSLGVDIAPLIAGAGVVGLAIGFGAQTLVKDIISGVFFLVDDAFRIGDYVEAGTAKGTVEQISLRSMKLRHPRGMVFTIPYGGLKILQNYSRDYIISKLDFRVRYDADIDKIRKIIKRINKEIMANEELNKGMLSDIKSMGVRKMEDSAMILRIKFKTVPGHQFLVEKELYRRVQEAFRTNGIEFAHRNVTVYFPPETRALAAGEKRADEDATRAAIGAAAAGAVAAEEERLAAMAAKASKEG